MRASKGNAGGPWEVNKMFGRNGRGGYTGGPPPSQRAKKPLRGPMEEPQESPAKELQKRPREYRSKNPVKERQGGPAGQLQRGSQNSHNDGRGNEEEEKRITNQGGSGEGRPPRASGGAVRRPRKLIRTQGRIWRQRRVT